MAKGKKGRRKGSKKAAKGGSRKSGIPGWLKTAAVIAGGAAVGQLAESAGVIGGSGSAIDGKAVGILAVGVASTGFRRMPAAPVLAGAAGFQALKTVTRTSTYQKLASKIGGGGGGGGGAAGLPSVAEAAASVLNPGGTAEQIAKQLGISPDTVNALVEAAQ